MFRGQIALAGILLVCTVGSACRRSPDPVVAGDQAFAAKDYTAALVHYRIAVQKQPQSGALHQKLARTMLELGAPDWKEFVRAADLLPDDADAQLDAAEALVRTRQYPDGKDRAERVLAKDSRNVRAHLIKGLATAGLNELDDALQDVRSAIESDPANPSGYTSLGVLQGIKGNMVEAEAALKQAANLAPADPRPHRALATLYWHLGRVTDTEAELRAAIKCKADDASANSALAVLLIVTNRSDLAEAPLRKAAEDANNPDAQVALADYYIGRRRLPEATTILTALAGTPRGFALAETRLANLDYAAGRREEAYRRVDAVLAKRPNDLIALGMRTRWLIKDKRLDEALDAAKKGTSAAPKSGEAFELLGAVFMARGEPQNAIEALQQALQLRPNSLPARVELARLNLAIGNTPAAVQFASEVTRVAPGETQARLTLIRGLRAQGDYTRAESELKSLMATGANSLEVQLEAGDLALSRKRLDEARVAYDKALVLDPASRSALAGRVAVDLSSKRPADALQRVNRRLATAPNDAALLSLKGKIFAVSGDLTSAESALQSAIAADPAFLEAYAYLGQIYVRTNRMDEALKQFDETIRRQPSNLAAHTMAATILQVQNRTSEARARYEKMLALDPRSVVAANNLAFMDADAGVNLGRALQLARTASEAKPESAEVNDTLGWVDHKSNLPSLAIAPLQKSLQQSPSNPVYRFHLGMAYLTGGDPAKGRALLEAALQSNPNFPGADEARQALSGGRSSRQ